MNELRQIDGQPLCRGAVNAVCRTVEIEDDVMVDYGSDGAPVGYDIQHASTKADFGVENRGQSAGSRIGVRVGLLRTWTESLYKIFRNLTLTPILARNYIRSGGVQPGLTDAKGGTLLTDQT